MNETFYQYAVENRTNYLKNIRIVEIRFIFIAVCIKYQINPSDNRFYFFNPFSIQIFMKIINNILISVEKSVRDIELVLYYPSEDYIYFLDNLAYYLNYISDPTRL